MIDPHLAALPLITPHGDRKPERGPCAPAAPVAFLITPHGDRKPPALARDGPGSRGSLPLMGIGNVDNTGGDIEAARRHSLPLMGIGNASQQRS